MKTLQQQIDNLVKTYTPYELAEMLVETEDALEDYRISAIAFYETPAMSFSRRLGDWWEDFKKGF